MKVYDALYFIISRTRRRYQRRRERADGVLLLRRGAPDEVYDALYAFLSYVEVLLMKVYDALYTFCSILD